MGKEVWNDKKASWYAQALGYSSYPKRALEKLIPRLSGINSILDVGAGSGALSLPLARVVKRVSALEPSGAMVRMLKKKMKRQGLKNVSIINSAWGETKLARHDALLIASVPSVLDDLSTFLNQAVPVIGKAFFLVQGVGGEEHKFFFEQLYPLIFKREFTKRGDYLRTLMTLRRLGVLADVDIFSYRFDQKFRDMDEAVDFWKEHLGITSNGYDGLLRNFLAAHLYPIQKGYVHKISKKSALISWRVK
ncbi:MAG: class I SAM-dependent methyltransferase [Thermodesulfobacteriota bacterium]